MTWVQAAAKQISILRGAKKVSEEDVKAAEGLLSRANENRKVAGLPLWQ